MSNVQDLEAGASAAQSAMRTEEYDVVVLGSGEGGKYVAWTLARKGKRVALVERQYIGGSCPNIACLPSKNIIHSAKVASYFARSEEFGITKPSYTVDMAAVRERKRTMVRGLVDVHLKNFQSSGAELILGSGRLIAPRTIEVTLNEGGTRVLRGEDVVLSTGTKAIVDGTLGLVESAPMTHIEALELDQVPKHLIVLGAGFIGLELAQAMRRFGSEVTVIDRNQRVIHREDEDVCAEIETLFRDEGIALRLGVRILSVEGRSGDSVRVRCLENGVETAIEGTHLLVAAGREPNTRNIGLEEVGVELHENGYIKVDERLQTTAPGVWAVGECAGSPQFTHIAFDDFRVVRDNILGGDHVTTGRQVPHCLFTDPEYARVGLSEREATANGIPYRLAKIPMGAVLRTRTLSETRGFMKALVDMESDQILGFMAVGVDAGEIMGAVQIAMLAGLPYTGLRDAVLTHPTLMEGLVGVFTAVPAMTSMPVV